jgi:hypothetical protein
MSYTSSYNLLADLALSAKASKILSGLIINYPQSQIIPKTIPMATMASSAFLARQGLYLSVFIHQIIYSNSNLNTSISLESSDFSFTTGKYERTFVHILSQLNSKSISLDNRLEWGELLITQLTKGNAETDLENWIIWTDDRGYLYFQPTYKALSNWLKMLFLRRATTQNSDFLSTSDNRLATVKRSYPDGNDLLCYIELRCSGMQKLVGIQINPWVQGELNCTTATELELIYGIIEVYDSLYMGAKYQIVAAGKSLAEKFLEFDCTCRLLDLNPNSPEFHEWAGLIAVVRSAVRDLLAHQATIDPQ